jgi:hypothetical protein
VPLLQIWFYASRRQQTEKKYSDLCSLLGLQRFSSPSRIKQQLGPSLDELRQKTFLSAWELTRTTDETDYKVCFWAGRAFLSSADLRLVDEPAKAALLDTAQSEVLNSLIERGIREDRARQILLDLPDTQPAMDQIEWGDQEINRRAQGRDPIANPPGFYIYLLLSNYSVPPHFETSRKRRLRQEARQREQAAAAANAQKELELYEQRQRYEAFLIQQTDAHINAKMTPGTVESRLRDHTKRIKRENPKYGWWPETALREFAQRRLRDEIAAELELPTFEEFAQQESRLLFA